jgi:toxin ParE1/3/4
MKIIWTEPTSIDLENIKNFIKKDSDYYAEIFPLKIIKAVEVLKDNPEIGRVVPEFNKKDIRELIFKNYRIIYKIDKDTIYILAVIHGSRLLKIAIKNSWEIE